MAKDLNRHSKAGIQMANGYIKIYSISLITREKMQIKATIRHHLTPAWIVFQCWD